ncbi:hypothetical protein WUBG_04681 [Wuchereria bancrofti]|uniref:Uncharacterized protein n=1 Tax=Wuchereria bancrofti TaxID=6293 RepID=J9F4K2_WUCBA|nr:hypothetical protein WUBG_04681 [Wuchereria bancrofti]VDM09407.1 unnamed protein product [Wuchereria bancrofti]
MAKSIRSKSKRRVRAIKRERMAPRVLKRLQATVSNLDCNLATESTDPDVQLVEMETDSGGLNLKTMKKPDGSYPVWLSQRKIKKKKREQKIKQNAKNRKARRTR